MGIPILVKHLYIETVSWLMAQLLGNIHFTSLGLGEKAFVTHLVSSGSQIDAHLRKRPIYVDRHTCITI